jgi:hypothetical protein
MNPQKRIDLEKLLAIGGFALSLLFVFAITVS